MKFAPFLLAASLFAAPAFAHGTTAGDLEIVHPHIPLPAEGAMMADGYMKITNHGAAADRLVAVAADFAGHTMFHEMTKGADGQMSMGMLMAIDIPAGATVELGPEGAFLMFALTGPLTGDMMYDATLTFEHAGDVAVEFMTGTTPGEGAAMTH